MAEKTRRALLVGGPDEGKWKNVPMRGHVFRDLKMPVLKMVQVVRTPEEGPVPLAPEPYYEEYVLTPVNLYGVGITVALHTKTLTELETSETAVHWDRQPYEVMVLRAILQRDVASEMGLL